MGVIAAYRRVLRNGPLTRLLVGEFVSSIGDWLYLVALLVLIWEEANDPIALGVIGAARILPYILLSVPAGIVADRFDRRLVLLITDVVRGVLMVVMGAAVFLGAPVIIVIALAILATCFSAFFSPAIGAYLPSLVRDESELGPANSAWASLDNLAFFIGPAFAAVLLGVGSLELAFLLNALTFGFVAVVLVGLPSQHPDRATAEAAAPERSTELPISVRDAIRPIRRPLIGIGLLTVADSFVFGGLGVITVVLAVDVLGAGEAGTGLLNSAIGIGGVIGALVAGVLVLRRRLGPPLLVGALVLGAGVVVLGGGSSLAIALGALVVASAGALLLEIVATTLLQRFVPDSVRGRVLGGMETVSVTAYAAGSFLIPVLGGSSPGLALIVSGVAMGIAGVAAVALVGRHAVRELTSNPDANILSAVEIFGGLPPARLEGAMRAARVMPMRPGQVVISQGEKADLFYVVAEGEVEVTQREERAGVAGQRVLRRLGRGQFFGEIGLLSGVPRTATVTAVSGGKLITLEKEEFLELVSAGPGLTYSLLNVHRGTNAGTGDSVPDGLAGR